MRLFACLTAVFFFVVTSTAANAAIILDYTHDTFFGSNATAMAAIEAAAADVSAVLNYAGSALNGSHNTVTGTSGSASATYDFTINYTNPATGGSETVLSPGSLPGGGLAEGDIRIYVGVRQLNGPGLETTLGQGGPGTIGLDGGSGTGGGIDFTNAVANANTLASAAYGRGDGPTIGTLTGTFGPEAIDIDFGPITGNLWFDSDTNNDMVEDFDAWHFDHTTAVAAGKNDLYSVALHEILHAVGYGVSATWDSLVSGTDWTGANAIALAGSGTGLIDGGGAHVASGTMSTRLLDGMAQEVVMDPTITTGTRKYLTALDVAFLQDIGYANASSMAVPEPGSFALCVVGSCCLIGRRYRRRRKASQTTAC